MSENTKIEWADHTFNPWIGCTRVSPACAHCYAACSTPARTMGIKWGPHEARHHTSPANWKDPVRWNNGHAAFFAEHGRRQRVFCASLADVFDNAVPTQWRIELMRLIMSTPNLDWLLLTKRIGNAADMLEVAFRAHTAQREGWRDNVPPHIWLGATVVTQAEADRDIPKLLATPAAVRFLSIEPMLGPINIADIPGPEGGVCLKPLSGLRWVSLGGGRVGCRPESVGRIDWVICGGESGAGARPMHPDWARGLRDQCFAAGVPFLFKQWGEWTAHEVDADGHAAHLYCIDGLGRDCALSRSADDAAAGKPWWHLPPWPGRGTWGPDGIPDGVLEVRPTGKKAAGRLLDGVEHNGFPEVQR